MPRREGACGPTHPKAPPVSALAITGDIEYVPFAVEGAPWLEGLPVGAYWVMSCLSRGE
jgi:hypothetical protein